MPVFQQGSVNTTALIVPDLYVQIVPPQVTLLNGVATNIIGIVGTSSWGPTNVPTLFWDMSSYSANFGPIKAQKYDMGTAVAAAVLQGANNFRGVRVTDGTDIAAVITFTMTSAPIAQAVANAINLGISSRRGPSALVVATVSTTTLTITALYTGTLGNTISVSVGPGSAAATTSISIAMAGGIPEVFDNIGNITTTASTKMLANGTDGTTTITASVLVGLDTTPRKGMYALRATGASLGVLVDADDPTTWSTQVAFGLSEGVYMICVGPAGQTVTTASTAKAAASCDSYAAKVMMGDWCFFQDNVNNQLRLISPQGFVVGRLANLSPEQSSLNKPIYGIVDTQATYANKIYSSAELAILVGAGIDVICLPQPGGNYYGCRVGHNSSSNVAINGDNYTRMTNYIAYTLNSGMGIFLGRLGSVQERGEAWATLDTFFSKMKFRKPEPMIDDYTVDPIPPLSNGFQICSVHIKYLDIVEKFIINVEGGSSVQITRITAN